jgi:hypothetical protein
MSALGGKEELGRLHPRPSRSPKWVYVEPYEGSDELGTRDFNVNAWMNKPRLIEEADGKIIRFYNPRNRFPAHFGS